ncbi:MAG: hypothetical protein HQL44_09335 [Alphaproteobacteria bacterium]|nr:hypothetical protein [Alphaproteobacteria bacterium]
MTMNEAQALVAAEIEELARKHGVVYVPTPSDELIEAKTRLWGNDVVTDRIEYLIIALHRAGVIDGSDMTKLLRRYLDAALDLDDEEG